MAGIVFFDIRDFSSHRQYLGDHNKASMLTKLVASLLNEAALTSRRCSGAYRLSLTPWMNHTGDGFLLIFRGSDGAKAALLFASEFRVFSKDAIRAYNKTLNEKLSDHRLKKLDWGIGIHEGSAVPFPYDDVDGNPTQGFIGSAINIASRVEACTKDHTFHVICTGGVREQLLKSLAPAKRRACARAGAILAFFDRDSIGGKRSRI